jgi:hypothetical protein
VSTPPPSFAVSHHYVPEWYQHRFVDPSVHPHKLHYLDLDPEKIMHPDGSFHHRRALRHLGPNNCFQSDHLYSMRFGNQITDHLEKNFFGKIDNDGKRAVELFSNYDYMKQADEAHENFHQFLRYMDAQKWRTPKGLDFLQKLSNKQGHQNALRYLGSYFQMHCTMWMESVWEVLYCDNSPTKFIISDHPVTTYNKGIFPASPLGTYPLDAPIGFVGTHTIFPLNLNRCLVLTNLGYVRNPQIKLTQDRVNARVFDDAMFDLRKIQTERQIDEGYVIAINYVVKERAKRYIAAARKEWLYPEKTCGRTLWNKLGGKYFLMPDPRKVTFHTQTLVGYNDGRAWGTDEYGRRHARDDDPEVKRLRDIEWNAFQKSKKSWDSTFGELSPEEFRKAMS